MTTASSTSDRVAEASAAVRAEGPAAPDDGADVGWFRDAEGPEPALARPWADAAPPAGGELAEVSVSDGLPASVPARERIFRLFVGARAAVGAALALGQILVGVLGAWASAPTLSIVAGYALAAFMVWGAAPSVDAGVAGSPWGLRRRVWIATIGVDVVCFGGLLALSPPGGPNYGALLVMPVLMGGVFMPRRPALALAAAVTIVLLVATGVLGGTGGADVAGSLAQAGLAGCGLFVVTLLASDLVDRLEREELSARGSLERARQEAQLNRLVIDDMRDGVLVVDRDGWVRRANPAARALIAATGGGPQPPFQLRGAAAWAALVTMIESAFAASGAGSADSAVDVVLAFEPGHRRSLRVRPRFIRRREARGSEDLCVLFLEDLRDVQARTRQEKLAAMGRVSAGIAHEIRNPLAAIAQANALIAEDAHDPGQQRLAKMVADNVQRLKRIVDDVLEAAPGPASAITPVDLTSLVATACADWAATGGVPDGVLQVELPHGLLWVHFDADHLRRVLVNLLENAWRHATRTPGSVRVRVYAPSAAEAALLVVNDGEAIPPDVERHLFEPFFSTRSRGTGLGLYICRELCGRYGARIDYRQRVGPDGPRNEFHVVMRRREPPPAGAAPDPFR
jgi:two-component system sensor histidine kinase PilS (NtrC family)